MFQRLAMARRVAGLDRWLVDELRPGGDLEALCVTVFSYLVSGHLLYRRRAVAGVSYPGRDSSNGAGCDEMEGFTRLAPLLAAWLAAGRPSSIELPIGETVCIRSLLIDGLRAGTTPRSPEYWGEISGPDQRVCEAADVALAMWLARDVLAEHIGVADLDQCFAWLTGAFRSDVRDNNWHLFPLTVDAVSRSFNRPCLDPGQREFHTKKILSMHCGDGWFRDGLTGPIDYYNSWAFHYSLYWLDRVGYPLGDVPYRSFGDPFLGSFKYLFTPGGFPVFGRSVCYRMAAPTGLLTAGLAGDDAGKLGMALRAVELTWRHFLERGALKHGRITAGCYHEDWRLMDGYSGPASPLWCLRSLIPLLAQPPAGDVWRVLPVPLPVEVEDFRLALPVPGWEIRGDHIRGQVDLFPRSSPRPATPRTAVGLRRILKLRIKALLGRSFYPPLKTLAYDRARYTSSHPFWEHKARRGD